MTRPAGSGVIEDLRRASSPGGRAQLGCCLVEGTRLLERALRAGRVPRAVVAGAAFFESTEPRERALVAALAAAGCEPLRADSMTLAEFTGGRGTGEIVGLLPIPEAPPLAALIAGGGVLLAAVDVEDPGNVGALSRTALASGAAGFLCCGISDPWHPRALRTSMGSPFKIPVITYENAGELLAALGAAGVRTLAAVSRGGTPLAEAGRERGACAVLMGSEAFGLSDEVGGAATERVTIPMSGEADSYSVNAAAAVLLYELLARR